MHNKNNERLLDNYNYLLTASVELQTCYNVHALLRDTLEDV